MNLISSCVRSLVVSFTVSLLASCGSSEDSKLTDQDKIYQQYEINYYTSSNMTEYSATFRKGSARGSHVTLSDPSRITINGKPMSDTDTYPRYALKVFGPPAARNDFVWVDANNHTYTNTAADVSTAFVTPPTTMIKSVENTVAFAGTSQTESAVRSNRIGIRVRSLVDSQYVERFADAGANVVRFEAGSLASLKAGAAEMRLRLESSGSLADATEAGGSMTITYEAELKRIQIQE